jgi:type II secretory pathway component PulF
VLAGGLLWLGIQRGVVGAWLDRMLHDGPGRATAAAITFGGFSLSLGNMLSAGAPMSDALRLAIRSVRSPLARTRLEPVAHAVRQGQPLSVALEAVRGFPATVVRMAAVGEASGSVGAMLARAGKLEEDAGVKRIEAIGRILGPALIVLLGGFIGLLMAGLLSGVSTLGQSALQ